MKHLFLVCMFLLLIPHPVVSQTPLELEAGEYFTYQVLILDRTNFNRPLVTSVTFYDDDSDASMTIERGNYFTITIIDPTIIKNETGYSQILIEYSTGGIPSFQSYIGIGFGEMFAIPDWESHATNLTQRFSDIGEDEHFEINETDYNFGYEYIKNSTQTITIDNQSAELFQRFEEKIVHRKITGVLGLQSTLIYKRLTFENGTTFDDTYIFELSYTPHVDPFTSSASAPNTKDPIPGFQFIALSSLFVLLIIRKKT